MASKNSNAQVQNAANQQRRVRTEAYAQQVKAEYAQAVNSILALQKTLPKLDPGVMYSFDGDSPQVRREVDKVLRNLYAANMTTIKTGIASEWEEANKEVDKLITSAVGKKALKNPQLAGWFARNEEALETFTNRSENGMSLSDRVWKNAQQFRDEMEIAMTVAIGEGQSASQMSRKVRQYLDDPDLMFRRFRYKDEDGNWRLKWKKRVQTDDGHFKFIDYDRDSYKTKTGVYKSSYKNAMRVTRTETNMAYRRADHDRWQNLEFVLGQNIAPSKSHDPEEDKDVCDQLKGKYPKDFVFEGWHPQCMCSCTAIMVSEDEMQERMAARLRGEDYQFKEKPVTTYPEGFQKFVRENKDNILGARKAGKLPYFLQENYSLVEQVFNGVDITDPQSFATQTQTETSPTGEVQATMTDDEIRAKVHEAFAAVNADIQDADIVIEDGHVVLTAQQAITLHKGMKTTPKQYDAIHNTYVQNIESFHMNEIARFNNKREYDPLVGSFANAKDRLQDVPQRFADAADALDKAIAKNSLSFPVRVVRMVDAEALQNLTGLSKSYGGTRMSPDELISKIKALGENVAMTEGGYMSFSFDANKNAFLRKTYRLKIDIPAGTPLYIPNNASESEGILGRNTRMTLRKISKTQVPDPFYPSSTKEIVEVRCGVASTMKVTQQSALERAKERHAARTEEQKDDIRGLWEESRRVNTMLEEAEKLMPDARRVFSWRMKDRKQDASDVAFRIRDISKDYANDTKGMAALGYQKQRDFLQEKIASIGRGEDAQLEKRALQQRLAEVEGHIAKGEHRDPMELKAARQAMRTEAQKEDIQKRWDATLAKHQEIRDNANDALRILKDNKDKAGYDNLKALIGDSNLTKMRRETANIEKGVMEEAKKHLPDAEEWRKTTSLWALHRLNGQMEALGKMKPENALKKAEKEAAWYGGLMSKQPEYAAYQAAYLKKVDDLKKAIPPATPKATKSATTKNAPVVAKGSPFADEAYSKQRKDKALWAAEPEEADKVVRGVCEKVWQKLDGDQKKGLWRYTANSTKFNKAARAGSGDASISKAIDSITDAIDKSTYKQDMWLQRTGSIEELERWGVLNPHLLKGKGLEKAMKGLVGVTGTEHGFLSTSTAKNKKYDDHPDLVINVYAPAGTKMMYCEPFSDYGCGFGDWRWDGKQQNIDLDDDGNVMFGESEMLIQRGTSLRITKVEYANGQWYIDAEVVGQSPRKLKVR